MKLATVALLSCFALNSCAGYNILALFPHPGLSHHYAFEPLFRMLLNRGHNLTAVTHFPLVDPPSNYKLVNLSGSYRIYSELMTWDRQDGSILGSYFHLKDVFEYIRLGVRVCDIFLKWPTVQPLYDSDETYDLIITEAFNSDCSLGFVNKFKAPHVTLTSNVMMPWIADRLGAINNPAYVPTYFAHHATQMNFRERVENTLFLYYHNLMYNLKGTMAEEEIMKRYFGEDLPSIESIAKNTSLIFLNSHHSLSGIVPRSPNVIEIGGMHIRQPKPLPEVRKST